jgi:hypothetical protein
MLQPSENTQIHFGDGSDLNQVKKSISKANKDLNTHYTISDSLLSNPKLVS